MFPEYDFINREKLQPENCRRKFMVDWLVDNLNTIYLLRECLASNEMKDQYFGMNTDQIFASGTMRTARITYLRTLCLDSSSKQFPLEYIPHALLINFFGTSEIEFRTFIT
jgi:hypothetical protein